MISNDISSLPEGSFSGLNNLIVINLRYANLSSLPEGIFSGLNNLKALYLDDNNLSSLPEGIFSGLNNLKTLNLGDNNLSSLPEGIFSGLNNLEELFLRDNNLSSLPEGIFSGLNNLKTLNLYNNNLSSLPEGIFKGLNNLGVLRLDNNNLSSLPEGIFSGLDRLRSDLHLDNNNLSCLPSLPPNFNLEFLLEYSPASVKVPDLPPCQGEVKVEVKIEPTSLEVVEGGLAADYEAIGEQWSYTVVLDRQPGENIQSMVVEVSSSNGAALTMQPSSLAFSRSNWNTPQTVILLPQIDGDRDDETVTLSHSLTTTKTDGTSSTVQLGGKTDVKVSVMEPGVSIESRLLYFHENNVSTGLDDPGVALATALRQRQPYPVVLDAKPSKPVRLEITSENSAILIADNDGDPTNSVSLVFTPNNWDTPQNITAQLANFVFVTGISEGTPRSPIDPDAYQFSISHTIAAATTDRAYTSLQKQAGDISNRSKDELPVFVVAAEQSIGEQVGEAVLEEALDIVIDKAVDKVVDKLPTDAKEIITEGKEIIETAEEIVETVENIVEAETLTDVLEAAIPWVPGLPGKILQHGGDYGGRILFEAEAILKSSALFLFQNHEQLNAGQLNWDQAFDGQSFSIPLSNSELAQAEPDPASQDPPDAGWNPSLSTSFDLSRFHSDTVKNGRTHSLSLGLDLQPRPSLFTGLTVALSRSTADFQVRQDDTDSEGDYEVNIATVHPYISWLPNEKMALWASLGYGRGQADLKLDQEALEEELGAELDEDVTTSTKRDALTSVAAGIQAQLWQTDSSALALKLEGATAQFLSVDMQRLRFASELSKAFPYKNGALNTSIELGFTMSNNAESATELNAGLNWLPRNTRLSATGSARVLLFSGDHQEWGIGGGISYQPRPQDNGEGLSFSLKPSMGSTSSRLDRILDSPSFSDAAELAISNQPLSTRLQAEMAYGFRTSNHALLTPYTEASLSHSSNTYTTGLRYQLDSRLNLDLSASHRTRSSGNNDNRFFLQLRSDL